MKRLVGLEYVSRVTYLTVDCNLVNWLAKFPAHSCVCLVQSNFLPKYVINVQSVIIIIITVLIINCLLCSISFYNHVNIFNNDHFVSASNFEPLRFILKLILKKISTDDYSICFIYWFIQWNIFHRILCANFQLSNYYYFCIIFRNCLCFCIVQ